MEITLKAFKCVYKWMTRPNWHWPEPNRTKSNRNKSHVINTLTKDNGKNGLQVHLAMRCKLNRHFWSIYKFPITNVPIGSGGSWQCIQIHEMNQILKGKKATINDGVQLQMSCWLKQTHTHIQCSRLGQLPVIGFKMFVCDQLNEI